MVGSVGDGQKPAIGEPIGEQVVEDPAVLAAQHAVLRAAFGDPSHLVGQHPLQKREGLRPARLDLAHVRDVEHADTRPDSHVLLPDALVLDGHLPAGERHQPGSRRQVPFVQRAATQRGLGGGGHCRSGYYTRPPLPARRRVRCWEAIWAVAW